MTAPPSLYDVPPGPYCVPAALVALTGRDLTSVILPALNRHAGNGTFFDDVGPTNTRRVAVPALQEMGYRVFAHGKIERGDERPTLRAVANRYPSRRMLATVKGHALAILDGRVWDTATPYGAPVEDHPDRDRRVTGLWIVEKKEPRP